MTQPKLAEAFGISYQAVAGWEADSVKPDLDKILVLRQQLRVTYAWLLNGSGQPPAPDAPEVLLDDRMSGMSAVESPRDVA